MVVQGKTGLFARFRGWNKKKLDDVAKASMPESAARHEKSESPTLADDTDSVPENINKKDGVEMKGARDFKAVRFPANDALKTTPGRSRRELQKPPTAREAAYGGPPRYDWIDIVSATYKFICVVISITIFFLFQATSSFHRRCCSNANARLVLHPTVRPLYPNYLGFPLEEYP
jgi:hypothetical protein